jgi:hypothetical protein
VASLRGRHRRHARNGRKADRVDHAGRPASRDHPLRGWRRPAERERSAPSKRCSLLPSGPGCCRISVDRRFAMKGTRDARPPLANRSRANLPDPSPPGSAKRCGPQLSWLVVDQTSPPAILTTLGAWGRRAGIGTAPAARRSQRPANRPKRHRPKRSRTENAPGGVSPGAVVISRWAYRKGQRGVIRRSAPVHLVQPAIGHSDLRTTSRYAHARGVGARMWVSRQYWSRTARGVRRREWKPASQPGSCG